jgi:hypothetical protein
VREIGGGVGGAWVDGYQDCARSVSRGGGVGGARGSSVPPVERHTSTPPPVLSRTSRDTSRSLARSLSPATMPARAQEGEGGAGRQGVFDAAASEYVSEQAHMRNIAPASTRAMSPGGGGGRGGRGANTHAHSRAHMPSDQGSLWHMSMAQRNCDFIKNIATSHGHMNMNMSMSDTLASSHGPQNSPRANSPLGAHVHTLGFERVEGLTVGGGVVKGTSCQKSFSLFFSCERHCFVKSPLCRHFIL